MLEKLMSQIGQTPSGWIVPAMAAAVIVFVVLRLTRRAIRTALRLAIIAGAMVIVAIVVLVFRAMLRGGGLPIP